MKRVYFKKLLLVYSGILFVLVMILSSVFISILGREESKRQIQQDRIAFQDYVSFQEQNYEALFERVNKVRDFNSVAAFACSSGNNYYLQMAMLRSDLQKYSDSTLPTFLIYKYGDDTGVSNYRSVQVSKQLEEFGIDKTAYDKTLAELSGSDILNRRFILTDTGTMYLTTKTYGLTRVIIAGFAKEWETVKDYGDGVLAGFAILDDDILDLRTDKEDVSVSLINALNSSNDIIDMSVDGHPALAVSSRWGSIVYYMLCSPNIINSGALILRYLPLMLLSFAVAFVLAIMFSKKLYEPIDHLVDFFSQAQENVAELGEKGNEMDYLAREIAQIRYQNIDLAQQLKENYDVGRQRYIKSLITGQYDSSIVEHEIEKYSLKNLYGTNYIVRMKLVDVDEEVAYDTYKRVWESVRSQIETEYPVEYIPNFRNRYYLIVSTEEISKLENTLSKCAILIEAALNLQLIFFISKPGNSIDKLQYSFLTLEKVYELRTENNIKTIYEYSEVKKLQESSVVYPVSTEQKLLNYIEDGNRDAAERTLNYIINEYGGAVESYETRQIFALALANTFIRCLQRLGTNKRIQSEISPNEFVDAFMSCTNKEQIAKQAGVILYKFIQDNENIQGEETENIKECIEKYVKDNIANDISLITMADAFRFSPNYMSTVFKDTMGETFKDYTSRVRFDYCVELMNNNPDITINELAQRAGFNNTTTLLRLFKKYAKCTPAEYLRLHRVKSEN